MKQIKLFAVLFAMFALPCFASSPHNLLPRLPQIVFDKASSDMFCVEELNAKVEMMPYTAQTELNVKLKNASETKIKVPLKFRVLYPTGKNPVSIKINSKNIVYNQQNPIYVIELTQNESADIQIKANISTNYSVNSIKKALAEQEGIKKSKLQSFGESFARYFNQETYGKRFMIGLPVSKWGIFPVEIKRARIEVNATSDIMFISEKDSVWSKISRKSGNKFICSSTEGFETAVFLPTKDEAAFKENQELLNKLRK